MKRKLMFFMTFLFIGIGLATAQTSKVTGLVTSEEDGQPVVGASVLVNGTTLGTITDIDGKFTISNVPSSSKTLRVSYVGMLPQEVTIKEGILKIVLRSDAKALDEVVVTALGIKRSEKILGYAASTVKNDDLVAAKSGSVMSGLSGKIAGVNISSSGTAGSSQKVIVRGYSSFSSNQPLYVIDGVPMSNNTSLSNDQGNGVIAASDAIDFGNGANDINPDDVESVTVLKGASATALYGSRAANGVVMITTKRAKHYIVLTEYGITEPFAIREQIEWDAVLYADDFYFRGQYWVRLLLGRDYKPQLIRPAWFWRFDRLYESKGVKAVYIRTMGLEVDSMRLAALIRRMKEADMSERIGVLREFRSE